MQFIKKFLMDFSRRFGSSSSKEVKQISWVDKPEIGFEQGNEPRTDFFKNQFYTQTVEYLKNSNPFLLTEWSASVIAASENANRAAQKIELLEKEIKELEEQKAAAQGAIQPLRREVYEERAYKVMPYKKPWWHWLLIFGLCYMLLLGLNQHHNIKLNHLRTDQYLAVGLNLLAAVGITLAIKETMSSLGKRTQRFAIERQTYLDKVAWWLQVAKGDGSLWMGLGFITLETCFAFPGLMSILLPSMAKQAIYQIATFGAAALSSTANVTLAWTIGLEEAWYLHEQKLKAQELDDQLKDILKPEEDLLISVNNELYERRIEATEQRIEQLREQLIEQKKFADEAEEKSRLEYERWAYKFKQSVQSIQNSSTHNPQNSLSSTNGNKTSV
jgi:hypothetical protein